MRESHQMHDPMALVTDSALGVFALVFAFRARRVHRMWALAFLFTAIGAYWFDFNDVYHLIQTVALWMLYRAALVMKPSS